MKYKIGVIFSDFLFKIRPDLEESITGTFLTRGIVESIRAIKSHHVWPFFYGRTANEIYWMSHTAKKFNLPKLRCLLTF